MKHRLSSYFSLCRLAVLGLLGAFLSGCSGSNENGQLPTVSVRGTVKIDGKPSNRAMLQLFPVSSTGAAAPAPAPVSADGKAPPPGPPGASGTVQDDGTYRLQTYAPDDGVPKGTYSVSIGPDYGKFKPVPSVTPLVIEIKEANSNLVLDFQTTGKGTISLPRPGKEGK